MNRASASEHKAKIQMTAKQEEEISTKLKAQNRMNVYPNRFDIALPFRVTTCKGRGANAEFKQHGYFTNVDVASAVGTICSKALFGDKALAGEFNPEIVEGHAEFTTWMADARNQEIIALAEGGTVQHSSEMGEEAETPVF